MQVSVTSLASGSSGNALLIRAGSTNLLVDCGVSQRTIERQLRHSGLQPSDLTAILLTHEHGDHTLSAGPLARRHNVPVIANEPTLRALGTTLERTEQHALALGDTLSVGVCRVRSFPVPHDAAAPVGYTICVGDWCIAVAIDLGSWDEGVVEGLRDADLIVLEANHDRERLRFAPYAWPVKQRIYSPLGHLDNIAAGQILARLGNTERKRTVWLAHLSEQANSPQIATQAVNTVLSLASIRSIHVSALPRTAPHHWQSDSHLQQMALF